MALIEKVSITSRGAMTMTGNTLGLGNGNNIAAFTTLDTTKQVAGFPAGTTLLWQENSSSAVLTLPAGSTVLYAQLNWGGSSISSGAAPQDVTAFINNPISFTTPLGTSLVSPYAPDSQVYDFTSNQFYGRSQDVTALVSAAGPGVYTVAGVPATITTTGNQINCCGWSIGIIYKNNSLPVRNMTMYTGLQGITAAVNPQEDLTLSGFISPAVGPVTARMLFLAMEGDAGIGNDTVSFGPNTGSLAVLSGPNNLATNFFASQINIANSESPSVGLIDTSGTFGTLNPTPGVTPPQGTRYGVDITNVASTNFTNNQTSAILRLATTQDAYAVLTVGVQLDVVGFDFGDAPDIDSTNGPFNYRTLLSSNGPRHGLINDLKLGTQVTFEDDAYENPTATGDDTVENIQDDGPTILPLNPLPYNANTYTFNLNVRNNTGSTANIYAWLDFNQDGIFETNEAYVTTVGSSNSTQTIPITFVRPAGGSNFIGKTFVRVRLTTETLVNTGTLTGEDTRSFGIATDGEVEDYILNITSAPFTCSVIAYRVSN